MYYITVAVRIYYCNNIEIRWPLQNGRYETLLAAARLRVFFRRLSGDIPCGSSPSVGAAVPDPLAGAGGENGPHAALLAGLISRQHGDHPEPA